MKNVITLLLLALSCTLGFSQSMAGTWYSEWKTESGEDQNMTATITDDAYSIDFMSDGTVDITGTYQQSGDQVTLQDNATGGENDCTGKGVYKAVITDTDITMTKVTDECEGRGGPDGVMKMSKK